MNVGDRVRYERNGEVFVGVILSKAVSVNGITRFETSVGHWITEEDKE